MTVIVLVLWEWVSFQSRSIGLFTVAKEVMFSLLFVCLSLCLLAALLESLETDLHEIFREA